MPSIKCKNVHILMTITILVWFTGLGAYGFSEENVSITIDPLLVQPTNSCTLTCLYDNSELLYSLKWFREQHEFFRYTPSELPQMKVFPMREIHVDVAYSNATQVVLRDVSLASSGMFTCEVTYELTFSSASAHKNLTVVQLPEHSPSITVITPYPGFAAGELLSADCAAAPSKPAPTLRFFLNNRTVPTYPLNKPGEHPSIQMDLILNEEDVCHEQLLLWCEASIDDVYKDHMEMILPATAKTDCLERKDDPQLDNDVTLTLEPTVVSLNSDCILTCRQNIEDKSQYTLKWYHEKQEFGRYTPTVGLSRFHTNIRLNMDMRRSNKNQIVLNSLNFELSGSFSCELIANGGLSIASDTKVMTVVESIYDPPTMNITVEYTGPGKRVTASCKSPRARPPMGLQFVLNNNTIGDFHVATKESTHHSWAELVLNDVLPEEMMNHNLGILRCKTNTINDAHSTYVEANI